MTAQEREDWENVRYRMEAEGFDYCWRNYSDFEEIEDSEFHRLRQAYIKAATELEDYVNNAQEI
jgi:hypothetical protein